MILAKNISQNQQFGLLTAVSKVKISGKTYIVCRCRCGVESTYLPDPLRVGKRRRCNACISHSVKFGKKVKDLTGQRYGKLSVIQQDLAYVGPGAAWLCRCDCGNMLSVSQQRFSAKNKTHCGCIGQDYSIRKQRVSAISSETIKSIVADRNGSIISVSDRGKLSLMCSKSHTWNTTIQVLSKGHWCAKCANTASRSKTLEDMKHLASSLGGQALCTEDPPSMVRQYGWICKKGHEFMMKPISVKKGRWCPRCKFKRENQIRDLVEELTGEKFPQKGPRWLTNPSTGGRLKFDAYCEKLKIAVEYNGEFHYREPPFKGASLKSIKYRDSVKKRLAKANGVKLIIVPYTIKNIREFLHNRLRQTLS